MALSQLHALIRHAQQRGSHDTDEPADDDFVGGFRHFRQAGSSRSKAKLKPVYTVHVICLDGPQYTEVDPGIIRKMNEKNLGSRTLKMNRKSSRSSLISKIGKEWNLNCTFKLMRAVKEEGRLSLKIIQGTTTASIKTECNRSKIYVLPDEQVHL
ncbi:uncharacterized protein LOC134681743 [Mytilus trossulus]|uniref:uncharacterized protein LOC134681743 n=1 Tax=Mytilus trossulus TaxID=6551 RepID=UPI0030064E2A